MIMLKCFITVEALSDSEITTSGQVLESYGERGYTSDSELYESQAKLHRSTSPLEIRPVMENGSWLLVSVDTLYLVQMSLRKANESFSIACRMNCKRHHY